MKRIYGVIAAGALALASTASPASAKLNSCDGPIVLGTTISVTGINSSLAGSWDKMTEMFEREFNKTGGVFLSSCNKKLPIKFVYYDDQSVAATAVSLYEKLATIDNVDLFVGPDWSSHGFPVSQVFEKYKIPSVMSNVATPKVYESGFKYIAGMALDASTWSKNYFDMLEHMNPKPKSVFWIVQDNLVTKAVHETNMQYAEKAGLKTVGTEGFAGTTKNFSGMILKVKAAQPDIIFISSFDAVSVPLLQQMRQLQVKAMDVHHIMANGSLARQADLEGVTGEIYWHEGLGGPVCGPGTRRAQGVQHQALRLSLDDGPDGLLSGDDPGHRARRRRRPRKGRDGIAQTRRDLEAAGRRVQVQRRRTVADRLLHPPDAEGRAGRRMAT